MSRDFNGMPCDCGHPNGSWHNRQGESRRSYLCDNCWTLTLVREWVEDLQNNNPGYLGKLVLNDYALYNEAMIALKPWAKVGVR